MSTSSDFWSTFRFGLQRAEADSGLPRRRRFVFGQPRWEARCIQRCSLLPAGEIAGGPASPTAFFIACLAGMFLFSGSALADSDTDFVEASLKLNSLGRYMQDGADCQKQVRDGWNGYPTQLCRYSGNSGATNLPVVLLDPDPNQIARWIVSACRDAGASHVRHCAERVALQTTCQSGFQFPIAGFVDEGEIFSFRDGVTARMEGTSSWRFAPKDITAAMKAVFEGAPAEAGKYARISSTERGQFAKLVRQPASKYDSLAWIGTTRDEYQSAWGKDSNRLITARVKASLSDFDRPDWGNEFDSFCINVAGCPQQKNAPNLCAKKWSRWPP